MEILDGVNQVVLPTQVSAILDIIPWLWYIPSNVSNRLAKLRDRNIKWFTAEIEERRVSSFFITLILYKCVVELPQEQHPIFRVHPSIHISRTMSYNLKYIMVTGIFMFKNISKKGFFYLLAG